MKLSKTRLVEFSKCQIHSNKKILENGYFILANSRILFVHVVICTTFIGVTLFGSVAIVLLD